MRSELYATLPIGKLFVRCALPTAFGMAFTSLYSVADGIFAGKMLGQNALAAINLVFPFLMIWFSVSEWIAAGASVRVSILLGQKDNDAAGATFTTAILSIAIIGGITGTIGLFAARPLLLLTNAETAVIDQATAYLRIHFLFAPVIMPFFALDNFLLDCGKQKYSMGVNIFVSLFNILTDFLFLVVFHMGVWASALASCISFSFGAIFLLRPFLSRKIELRFCKRLISLHEFTRILFNGASEFFSGISSSVFMVILNMFLLAYGGTVAIAAFSVGQYVDSIVSMVIFGLCSALTPALSYCYGAGLKKRVWDLEKFILRLSSGLSLFTLFFLFFGGSLLVPVFVKDGDMELAAMSARLIRVFSFSYAVGWIAQSLSAFLTAVEKAGRSLVLSLADSCVLPMLALFTLAPLFGLQGIWWTAFAAGVCSAILAILLAGKILRSFSRSPI